MASTRHIQDNGNQKCSLQEREQLSKKMCLIYFLVLYPEFHTMSLAVPPLNVSHGTTGGKSWVAKDEWLRLAPQCLTSLESPHSPAGGEGQSSCGLVDSPEMSGPHGHRGRAGLFHHDPLVLIGLTNHNCLDHHCVFASLLCLPESHKT